MSCMWGIHGYTQYSVYKHMCKAEGRLKLSSVDSNDNDIHARFKDQAQTVYFGQSILFACWEVFGETHTLPIMGSLMKR